METFLNILKKFGLPSKIEKAQTVKQVAFFGFADAKPESKLYKEAFHVAKALAEADYVVVDGGGTGVMEAATLGAKAGGGKVIGVTLNPKEMPEHFEGRDPDNHFDVEIKTENYVERTLSLMQQGQVYVIFNGASGTMSEFGMAWGLARIYFGHHKPLILYGRFWYKIMKALKDNLLLRPEEAQVYKIVSSPKEVLRAIKQFEDEIDAGRHKDLKISAEEGYAID
ncbi:LOG family protein [Candidatus Daviesbacteria bacterium]|nr:LOG family protein [Candidatus Daviesbacteria bacterium]